MPLALANTLMRTMLWHSRDRPRCSLAVGECLVFMTDGLAAILLGFKIVIGSLIGLIVAGIIYRSRFGFGIAVRGILLSSVAFLLVSGIAGWAGEHAAFQNGHRINVAPWGEDLRSRNLITENELMLCIVSSSGAACLAGLRLGKSIPLNSVARSH